MFIFLACKNIGIVHNHFTILRKLRKQEDWPCIYIASIFYPTSHNASRGRLDWGIILIMNIEKIYEKYEIIPNLQEHMFRVAGVGYLVANNWKGESVDVDLVVLTCLLHDMGNIVKFDFDNLIIPIENVKYWKGVQREFQKKYGKDAHEATKQIIKELGRSDLVEIIEEEVKVYGKSIDVIKSASFPVQVLLYSDMRVMPNGVVGMSDRLDDLQQRYESDKYDLSHLFPFEEYLQEMTKIDIKTINEDMVKDYYDKFLSVTI